MSDVTANTLISKGAPTPLTNPSWVILELLKCGLYRVHIVETSAAGTCTPTDMASSLRTLSKSLIPRSTRIGQNMTLQRLVVMVVDIVPVSFQNPLIICHLLTICPTDKR